MDQKISSKTFFAIYPDIVREAIFDETNNYRYTLRRHWKNGGKKLVNFILLNPSTADAKIDDPTIRACMQIADNWGYDGIVVTNLFAYRATKPTDLKKQKNPIGEKNNEWIKKCALEAPLTVVAWGNHGLFQNRGQEVVKLLAGKQLHCLEVLKNGCPRHPLYVRRKTEPVVFDATNLF